MTTTTTTAGQPIQCMAMVARAAKQPLTAEMITVDPPKAGEVRVKVIGTLCNVSTMRLLLFVVCNERTVVTIDFFYLLFICPLKICIVLYIYYYYHDDDDHILQSNIYIYTFIII